MIQPKLISLALAMAFSLSWGVSSCQAADADASSPQSNSIASTLTQQQRRDALRQFVNQWGPYVKQVYGVDVTTWSQRLDQTFATGDATNIQRALQRDTFEGATAELTGVGHRLSDDQAITELSKLSGTRPVINALGDLDRDIVFNPVTPCRIADTRLMSAGPIAAGTNRLLGGSGRPIFSGFGGSSTTCALYGAFPDALLLNITAVNPSGAGYATAYDASLAVPPAVATVNYTAGAIVNNLALVRVSKSPPDDPFAPNDYRIFSYATSHYVVDVVGYFSASRATALDCVTVEGNEFVVAAGETKTATGGLCPARYTAVGGVCKTLRNVDAPIIDEDISNTRYDCQVFNPAANLVSQNVTAGTRCCRVPGQ